MLLVEYLNSQFSLLQNLDFILRILVASLCGAGIGFERSKRYKEAGIRTHIIVCCGAALLMVVSKYGFADLTGAAGLYFNGTRGADPARIAAQVVSGIGFLGAGVIFKHGSSIKGMTTAAGLWTTAGIGLAIGAGMYGIGIFASVLVGVLQILTHKFVVGTDSLFYRHLQFTVQSSVEFQAAFDGFLERERMRTVECRITYHEDGYITYDMVARVPRELTVRELDLFLKEYGDVRFVSCNTVG